MKITILNDTSIKSHIGCLAVSYAHAKLLGERGHKVISRYFVNELRPYRRRSVDSTVRALQRNERLLEDLRRSDAIIINGEGTIHHNGGIEYFAVMKMAKAAKRSVFLVNSLYQAMDFGAEILRSIDGVHFRDALSFEYAKSLDIGSSLHPDSIIHADFTTTPSQDFMKGVVFSDWTRSNAKVIGRVITDLMWNKETSYFWPIHDVDSRRNWAHAVATIKTASLLISSRHHALYLALLAGTPILPIGTKSWKIQGLVKMLDLPVTTRNVDEVAKYIDHSDYRNEAAISRARQRLISFGLPPWVLQLGKGACSTVEAELETLKADLSRKRLEISQDGIGCLLRRRNEINVSISKMSKVGDGHWHRATSLLRRILH